VQFVHLFLSLVQLQTANFYLRTSNTTQEGKWMKLEG
jgi:hypothetical protein